jgi:hypothetical protein
MCLFCVWPATCSHRYTLLVLRCAVQSCASYHSVIADTAADAPARQDPTYLWRDLLAVHSAFPMHCLVGGGDQVYNDGVWKDCPGLKAWGDMDGLYVSYIFFASCPLAAVC